MNTPDVFPAVVADPVQIHRHRPSADCTNRCHVIEARDLPALIAGVV